VIIKLGKELGIALGSLGARQTECSLVGARGWRELRRWPLHWIQLM